MDNLRMVMVPVVLLVRLCHCSVL